MRRESETDTSHSGRRDTWVVLVAGAALASVAWGIGNHDSSSSQSWKDTLARQLPKADLQFLRAEFPGYVLPLERYRIRDSLAAAIDANDESEVLRLLDAGAEAGWGGPRDARASDTRAPLFRAIRGGNARIVEALLERGAPVGGPTPEELIPSRNQFSQTPLYFAVRCGHREIVKLLLQHGAAISGSNGYSKTPLVGAVEDGDFEMFEYLLSQGAECDFATSFYPDRVPSRNFIRNEPTAYFDRPFVEKSASCISLLQLTKLSGNQQLTAAVLKQFQTSPQYSPHRLAAFAVSSDDVEGLRRMIDEGYDPATYQGEKNDTRTLRDLAVRSNGLRCFELLKSLGIKQTESLEKDTVLRLLVTSGALKELQRRLDAGAKFAPHEPNRGSPLRLAVSAQQEAMVQFLLQQPQADEWLKDTRLLLSGMPHGGFGTQVQRSHSICRTLLKAGVAMPDVSANSPHNPLQLAAARGWVDFYRMLEQRVPAKVNHDSALNDAVRANQSKMCRYLLAAGANPSVNDGLVKWALYRRNNELLQMLAMAGADCAYPDQYDVSRGYNHDEDYGHPLYNAALAGDTKFCRQLIRQFPASAIWEGLKYDQYEYDNNTEYYDKGNTPLFAAVFGDRAETLQSLLEHVSQTDPTGQPRVDINARNKFGATALHLAVMYGASNCVQLLIAAGADTTLADKNGNAPIHIASLDPFAPHHGPRTQQQPDVNAILPMLIAANVRAGSENWINRKNQYGKTPLHLHAQAGHFEACRMLLANGADANATTEHGETVLAAAMYTDYHFYPAPEKDRDNRSRICESLLDAGANLTARPYNTKLSYYGLAYRRGLFGFVKELERRGIRPALATEAGEYLCSAVFFHRHDALQHWIAAGADVNAHDSDGNTALHKAASSHDLIACKTLLANGADPNLPGEDGQPVMFLVFRRFHNHMGTFFPTVSEDSAMQLLEMLFDAGANPLLTRPTDSKTILQTYDGMPERLRQLIATKAKTSQTPKAAARE